MKRFLTLLALVLLALSLLVGCSGDEPEDGDVIDNGEELIPISVGATPAPHAEILEVVKPLLLEMGYDLKIVDFVDYVQPNLAVESGDIDANYFQHQPYLDDFNTEKGTDLVPIASVHYEPFGIYPGKVESLDALPDGAKIAVPNDTTNEARALLLLEAEGLIRLKENSGLTATKNDIVDNPRNFEIIELEAAQIPRSLPDVDVAVINGNYALEAGLNVGSDALATEDASSIAAKTYANVLVVKAGNEDREDLKALADALLSPEVKAFIESTYEGAVVPMF